MNLPAMKVQNKFGKFSEIFVKPFLKRIGSNGFNN
jgi:hypothetical protein